MPQPPSEQLIPAKPSAFSPWPERGKFSATVAIIGGGLAGLAAACALSSIGIKVTLFERRPYLGGRASSYEHPGTGEVVDNCQHVLFRLCTNLLSFYQRIGIEDKIRWFDRMTFIEPGGRQSVLQSGSLPVPFHAAASFLGFKFLGAKDKLALSRALVPLVFSEPGEDTGSFHDWLVRHGQTHTAIERFWKPVLVSALSEDLDRISVGYAAQVVRESMKSRQARVMGIPTVPLSELYNAARDYIVAQGGEVRLRSSVQGFQLAADDVRIQLQDSEEAFDYAVAAVPVDSLSRLLPDSSQSAKLRDQLAHFETSPITGVHFWFDRQITDLPHAVLLDRTVQWMFQKSMLICGGKPGEPRRESGRPSYIELVISSSKSLINRSRQEIIDLALNEVREFFAAAGDAQLVKATVIKEVNATFSPTPGIDQYRPQQRTDWPRIFLAGDWTATGWPATMEGAVRSGYLAAEALCATLGGKDKFIVPVLPAGGLMRLFW